MLELAQVILVLSKKEPELEVARQQLWRAPVKLLGVYVFYSGGMKCSCSGICSANIVIERKIR